MWICTALCHVVGYTLKAPRYGPCVRRGSHSFTCYQHTNHTCLYSPSTRCQPTKGWLGWVGLGGWLHTDINVPHRKLNLDNVIHPSTNRVRCRLILLIEANKLPHHYTRPTPNEMNYNSSVLECNSLSRYEPTCWSVSYSDWILQKNLIK